MMGDLFGAVTATPYGIGAAGLVFALSANFVVIMAYDLFKPKS